MKKWKRNNVKESSLNENETGIFVERKKEKGLMSAFNSN